VDGELADDANEDDDAVAAAVDVVAAADTAGAVVDAVKVNVDCGSRHFEHDDGTYGDHCPRCCCHSHIPSSD
jgi:hypothetical protein